MVGHQEVCYLGGDIRSWPLLDFVVASSFLFVFLAKYFFSLEVDYRGYDVTVLCLRLLQDRWDPAVRV